MKVLFNHLLSAGLRVTARLRESHQFVTSLIIFSASCLPLHLMSYFTSVINVFFKCISSHVSVDASAFRLLYVNGLTLQKAEESLRTVVSNLCGLRPLKAGALKLFLACQPSEAKKSSSPRTHNF